MPPWIQETIADWNWSVFWPEVLGKAAGVTLGILLSWFLVIRRRLQSMGKLQRGDSDDVLFQAHYLHRLPSLESPDGEHVQLLFRNIAEKRTVQQIYDNPAAAELVRTLGDQTTLNQPILPTAGKIGFEVLNDAAGWISGCVATSANDRERWMFCVTAEDRQVVRKRCVRCFLIRPDDLHRFHDWNWCKNHVRVERPWHWFRVVALHRISRLYADQCRVHFNPGQQDDMPLVDDQTGHRRIVPLSLGLIQWECPVGEPYKIGWDHHLKSKLANQLILEDGAWPSGLDDG